MTSLVHMRGTKLPEGCGAAIGVQTSDGAAMQRCLAPSRFQCDWDIGNGRTCDRHLCQDHTHQVGPDRHLCPIHITLLEDGCELLGPFTPQVQS
ncbi:MAG: hypothetical protein B7Y09_22305 [Polaromonas sp. 24-63-21]|nr:MAG: hypothetical protein B7Y09_22305 [Polaromonas sp. 24-63-21]